MIYNVNRDTEKDPSGKDWLDVFSEWKEPEAEQSEDEMLTTMKRFAELTQRMDKG